MASVRSSTARRLVASLLVLCVAHGLGQSALAQTVVINEILPDPSRALNIDGEWFEIHNPTMTGIDIDGWMIMDNDFDFHVVNNGGPLVVPAGGFLVLGNNADIGRNGGVAVDYQFSRFEFILSNTDDEIVLLDANGIEMDRVVYDTGDTFPSGNGASMSLIDPTLDNNVGANWCAATTPYGNGDLGTPGGFNDCAPVIPPFGECGDPATLISEVQGNGPASPFSGESGIIVEGVVVADFQRADQLGGFFLQEEDAQADGDPLTSDGIFVFDNGVGPDVRVGDVVRVEGTVTEFFDKTEINEVTNLAVCASGVAATPATVTLPLAPASDFERFEGMLVSIEDTLFVTGNANQGRFGEVELSIGGPLDVPTNVVAPGPEAIALRDLNDRSRIQLDDGSGGQNPLPLPPYIGDDNTLRTGDTVPGLTAAMDYSFGAYELHPVGPVNFTRVNNRTGPPDVGGTVRVASFNTLNYFTTLDDSGPICGPLADQDCRGADTAMEFMRQRAKLVAAIAALDADVAGLIEIENDATDMPLADLVDGLNDVTAPGTYAYIPTGAIGGDAIRVGLIFKPAALTPLNAFAILDSTVDPTFDDARNRPVLAQSFTVNENELVFSVAVNHLKSKGSDCDDVMDPDAGDGQGDCNGVRTRAATALTNWLAGDPTGSGSDDSLIIGDLNAYAQEDPIAVIEMAGYADLIEAFSGTGVANGAYSINFAGESGYLDHALSSPGMTPNVTGAASWHINADEPRALDYNDFNQPDLYNADEFRSSDHDPILIGLFGDSDGDGVVDAVDAHPQSDLGPAVVVNGCDSAVANDVLPSGSSIADLVTDAFNAGGARAVGRLVRDLKKDGILHRSERSAIASCARVNDKDDDSDSDSDRRPRRRSDDDSDSDSDSDSDRHKKKRKRRRSDDDSDSDSDDDSDRRSKKKNKKRRRSDDDSDSDSD